MREPTLRTDDPVLGAVVTATGRDALPGAAVVVIVGLPGPALLLTLFECAMYVDLTAPVLVLPATHGGNSFTASVTIPNDINLSGLRLAVQAMSLPGEAPRGFDLSTGVLWSLGR